MATHCHSCLSLFLQGIRGPVGLPGEVGLQGEKVELEKKKIDIYTSSHCQFQVHLQDFRLCACAQWIREMEASLILTYFIR